MEIRFTHTRLLVAAEAFGATYRFYRDTLGLVPLFDGEKSVYAEFRAGGAMGGPGHVLALFREDLMADAVGTVGLPVPTGRDRVVVTFEVDRVDDWAAELRSKGVSLVTEPHDRPAWMIRVAHFRDPAGHLVEINAPLRIA
jgi:catechol 2,3-dioxygenase-like lactoylglutathione lyase family enzyme